MFCFVLFLLARVYVEYFVNCNFFAIERCCLDVNQRGWVNLSIFYDR